MKTGAHLKIQQFSDDTTPVISALTGKPLTHTPGPWRLYADVPSVEPNWHIITTENRLRVIANIHIEPGNDMDSANARLISAAPELYALIRAYRMSNPTNEYAAKTDALIAKIEGVI